MGQLNVWKVNAGFETLSLVAVAQIFLARDLVGKVLFLLACGLALAQQVRFDRRL